MQRLDFINEEMQKEHHAMQTFAIVDQAMKKYCYITGKQLDSLLLEPKLSDYYTLLDFPYWVSTIFVFVTVYILFSSRSLHLLYWGVGSLSNSSNWAVVISCISFAGFDSFISFLYLFIFMS